MCGCNKISSVQGQDPSYLEDWSEATLGEALMMLTRPYGKHTTVRKYVMRCLSKATDDELVFWLPQIVQSLRTDSNDPSSLRKCALILYCILDIPLEG